MQQLMQFQTVSDEGSCLAPGCGQQASKSNPLVFHTNGLRHPMHLECALAALKTEGKCAFCEREIDAGLLEDLKKRVALVEVDRFKATQSAGDRKSAGQLDEKTNSGKMPSGGASAAQVGADSSPPPSYGKLTGKTDEELAKELNEELNGDAFAARPQSQTDETDEELAKRLHEELNGGAFAGMGNEAHSFTDEELAKSLHEELNGDAADFQEADFQDMGGAAGGAPADPIAIEGVIAGRRSAELNDDIPAATTFNPVGSGGRSQRNTTCSCPSGVATASAVAVSAIVLYILLNP